MASTLDYATAAELLGIKEHQVMGDPVIASCGLPFHLIELTDQDALESVCISAASWANAITPSNVEQIYLYVNKQRDEIDTTIHSRMFSMHASIVKTPLPVARQQP